MNTAINTYISNYESCYSRDGNGCAKPERNSQRRRREKKESAGNGDRRIGTERGLMLQLSFVCALIGLSRPSDLCVRLSGITKLWEVTVGARRGRVYILRARISREIVAQKRSDEVMRYTRRRDALCNLLRFQRLAEIKTIFCEIIFY